MLAQYEGIQSVGGNFNYYDVRKKVSRSAAVTRGARNLQPRITYMCTSVASHHNGCHVTALRERFLRERFAIRTELKPICIAVHQR